MSDDKLAEIEKRFRAREIGMGVSVDDMDWLLATCAEQAGEIEKAEQEIFQLEDDKAKLRAELAELKAKLRKDAGYDPKRCACVFDQDDNELATCEVHRELKARCDGMAAALDVIHPALRALTESYDKGLAISADSICRHALKHFVKEQR